MNSFFNSKYNYCLIICMFYSHIMNYKINRLHERCWRQVGREKTSTLEKLLKQDKFGICKYWRRKSLKNGAIYLNHFR